MRTLVLIEHGEEGLRSANFNTISAAKELSNDIDLLIIGENCSDVSKEASKIDGVSEVLLAENAKYKNQLAEDITPVIVNIAQGYDFILSPASTYGKNILPRVAALLDVMQISDVIAIENENTFVRPIYAGNAMATIQTTDKKKILTIRATAFEAAKPDGGNANIKKIESLESPNLSEFVGQELSKSERPELTSARIIISGGRGMQNGENFSMLEKIADKLGAAVGASRAAVDAGFVPNDYQVGQTGKIVAPDLYIAVGISGAIQHLAGMKDSKVIVAINKDEEAPIFQIADYGIVGDLFKLVPELEENL